jgi:hypothetical protein
MLKTVVLSFITVVTVSSFAAHPAVDGAEFPSKVRVAGHELVLNGVGARKKALLQLYLAGLYLTEPTTNARAIIGSDVPMAIRIEIVSGFVSQENIVAALDEGFENSTNGNTGSVEKEIYQFRQCFADRITKGDVFEIVYMPSRGTFVVKNGTVKGVIAGLTFKRALFGIWLSDKPADEGLKIKMLGLAR